MNPAHNRQRGKRTEKAIAKLTGGKRIGILGKDDVQSGPFSIEVKDRISFVGRSFMEQSVRNCPEGKTPLVVVHITGSHHADDLVLMRLSDWRDWFGNITTKNKKEKKLCITNYSTSPGC